MADVGLPLAAIREQVADAIDLVVRQERGADGVRRVVEVAEVVRVAGGPAVRELFAHRGGRPSWRAPLGDSRVAAAAATPPPSPAAAPAVSAGTDAAASAAPAVSAGTDAAASAAPAAPAAADAAASTADATSSAAADPAPLPLPMPPHSSRRRPAP